MGLKRIALKGKIDYLSDRLHHHGKVQRQLFKADANGRERKRKDRTPVGADVVFLWSVVVL